MEAVVLKDRGFLFRIFRLNRGEKGGDIFGVEFYLVSLLFSSFFLSFRNHNPS